MASVILTAVSLHPLPSSAVLRDALEHFLERHDRPGDILRSYADMLDAGEIPGGVQPVHEAESYLEDYQDQVFRKSFRVDPEIRDRLRRLSFATGLAQTALIRLSLNQGVSLEAGDGPEHHPDQMDLFAR